MDTLQRSPEIEVKDSEVEERLEVFVRAYVSEFETKLEEYAKEAEVGGIAKTGKVTNALGAPLGTAASVGAGLIGGVVGLVGKSIGEKAVEKGSKYFSGKTHRNKAKKIIQIFQSMAGDELRQMFVAAASLIYYSFQGQFESVTDADGNWKRALSKLAIDARNRSISYLYNEETTVAIQALSKILLTKALILGESKDSLISHVTPKKMQQIIPGTKPGHTLKNESKDWKTSDIYEKVGIKIVGSNGQTKYYKKKMCGNDYGYRWAFNWENDSSWISTYEEDYNDVSEDLRIFLKLEELEVNMAEILTNINKADPKLQLHRIEGGVDETKETLEKMKKVVEDIVPMKQDISEIKTKISSELPNPRTSLKLEAIEDKMDQVLTNINKEDPKLQLDRIEGGVDTVVALQKAIVPMKQDLHEIKSKLSLGLPKSDQPKNFKVTAPVKTFTGRERELTLLHEKLQTPQKHVVVSQCATISGLGGMGKSELARRYAQKYHECYRSCIWIDSETQSSITQSFRRLAEKLQIPITQNRLEGERNTLLIVEDIYERFSNSKCLFIFDNVNEYKEIKDFLPSNLSPTDEKPTIIITSRSSDWDIGDEGDIGLILLDQFTPEEALSFVKKVMEIKDEDISHDSSISELTKELCCFPLALRQAASYIKAETFSKSAIKNYLVEFRDEKKKRHLLQHKTKRDRYTETTYTTWQITFRNIGRNEANGALAIRLVEVMAYLQPDDIPLKGFIKLAENDEDLNEAKDILVKYSIITLNEKCRRYFMTESFYHGKSANIHRLVQQVIRLWLQEEKRERKVLRAALTQIHDNVPRDHQGALWSFACNYTALIGIYVCKICKKNKSYDKLECALKYLVRDGDTRTIRKILNYLEGRNDWRETSNHLITNLIDYIPNDKKHVKASVLFHAEVFNALKHSNTKDLELFLQSFDKSLINSWSIGITALNESVRSGNLNVVKTLVENGADVNWPNDLYGNALNIALTEKHPQLAEYLLDHGANSNITDWWGWTVLESASYHGYLNIVKRLVHKIAKCENGTEVDWGPLDSAVEKDQVEVVKFLTNHEVYRSAMKDHGQTLCRDAAEKGSIQVVKYLIDNKLANVNGRDSENEVLLMAAVNEDQFDVVKYLLSDETPDKVDIDAFNVLGNTPLFQTVFRCNIEIARLLIEHGAAVENVQNGNTPFGQLNISALHLAAADDLEIVKLLVEKCNANINLGLNTTFSPLQVAKFFYNKEVSEFLVRNGADTSEWSDYNLEYITGIIRSFYEANKEMNTVSGVVGKFHTALCSLDGNYRKHQNHSEMVKKRFQILHSYLLELLPDIDSDQGEEYQE